LLLAIFLASTIFVSQPASATSTQINANICGGINQGSTISITSPASDSSVDSPTLLIEGTVSSASQIVSTVNGQYSQTVALSINQSTFQLTETLTPGTTTIELVAYDTCAVQNDSDSIVVTYSPNTDPGDGGDTPTDVDTTGGGVVVSDKPTKLPEQSMLDRLRTVAVAGPIISLIEASMRAIGLDSTVEKGGIIVGAFRVGLFFAGLMMTLFASVMLQNFAMRWVTGLHALFPRAWRGKQFYRLWTVRIVGAALLLLALWI